MSQNTSNDALKKKKSQMRMKAESRVELIL